MAKRLDENLGAVTYDGLIVSGVPAADVVSIKLAASQGTLVRGPVVTGTAGGELSKTTQALIATNATYILAEDCDTGTSTAAVAIAYRTGYFARNLLTTDGSYTLTAADEEILRNAGILLSDALGF